MGQFKVLQNKFDGGYRRDVPRDQLPPNALYDCSDLIPNYRGWALRQRDRWGYHTTSDFGGSASRVHAGIYAPFTAAAKNLAIDEDGNLWDVTAATAVSVGAVVLPVQNPVFYRGIVIIPHGTGAAAPKWYDGTTLQTIPTGTNSQSPPPSAKYAAVYKSRLLLANGTGEADGGAAVPERVFVSGLKGETDPSDVGAGSPSERHWNTEDNGDWFDLPQAVTGMGALRAACLIFSRDRTYRLRGSTPGRLGDMVIEPLFTNAGCSDARSICFWEDSVIWADLNGVYMSDGSTINNLVEQAGIASTEWAPTSSYLIPCGVYQDYLFVNLITAAGQAATVTYMFDLNKRTVVKLTNFDFQCFWSDGQTLYGGMSTNDRVGKPSDIFSANASSGQDANGTNYYPTISTPYYREDKGLARLKNVYITYGMREQSGDTDPIISVLANTQYADNNPDVDIANLTWTDQSTSATTELTVARKRIPFQRKGEGLSLSLTLDGSNRARMLALDAIEIEFYPMEKFRV